MPHDETSPTRVRIHALAPVSENGCLLLLEEVEGARLLPIFTGPSEAQALALEFSGVTPPRPMTHDLLVSVIEAMGGSVSRVVVSEVKDSTYYARIELKRGDEMISIDARPSDAINVAVRCACPIYVASQVFANTDTIMKPIAEDEIARFKEQLEKADVSREFDALEGRDAPKEN
jgi:bifunctional DNase/RNase